MSIAIQWIFVCEMAVDFRSANWGGAVGAGSSFLCCQFFFVYIFDLFNIFLTCLLLPLCSLPWLHFISNGKIYLRKTDNAAKRQFWNAETRSDWHWTATQHPQWAPAANGASLTRVIDSTGWSDGNSGPLNCWNVWKKNVIKRNGILNAFWFPLINEILFCWSFALSAWNISAETSD